MIINSMKMKNYVVNMELIQLIKMIKLVNVLVHKLNVKLGFGMKIVMNVINVMNNFNQIQLLSHVVQKINNKQIVHVDLIYLLMNLMNLIVVYLILNNYNVLVAKMDITSLMINVVRMVLIIMMVLVKISLTQVFNLIYVDKYQMIILLVYYVRMIHYLKIIYVVIYLLMYIVMIMILLYV